MLEKICLQLVLKTVRNVRVLNRLMQAILNIHTATRDSLSPQQRYPG